MDEKLQEHINRVKLIATGNETWDLSDNDLAALNAILQYIKELEDALSEYQLRESLAGEVKP
jgi:hypothetical protein